MHDLVMCPSGEEGEAEHGEEDCGMCVATKNLLSM